MTKRKLLGKIKDEFPELRWKNAEYNIQGWDHYVVILDNKYVFRFPKTKWYIKNLRNEVSLLQYLKKKVSIPIPNYDYIAKDKGFAGYKIIKGEQLRRKIFKILSNETKNAIAKQMAIFLSSLHKTPLNFAHQHNVHKANTLKMYKELVRNTNKYIFPRISKRNQSLIKNYLKELKNYLKFPNKVLTHGDLYTHHILLSKSKKYISGIIDFGDAKIYDPAVDFTELWLYGKKFVLDVYKQYKGPKDKNFLKRSMMYYKRVPLSVMISRLQGMGGNFKLARQMFKDIFLNKDVFN